MDKTIAPARQPIRPAMYELLSSLPQNIVIVSGQLCEKIAWQTNNLPAYRLGQNGNHAIDHAGTELWNTPLSEAERAEILAHIATLTEHLPEAPSPAYTPVEDRGAQITFSPIGNTAPIELKKVYDPAAAKRLALLKEVPFTSATIMAVIGGSTSIDYVPRERHKGTNVQKLIELMGWNKDECVYFGDGLYPGGNDEFVIGVIDTVLVESDEDCEEKVREMVA